MTERGIGDNGGPHIGEETPKFNKRRWALALFAHPDKPFGAVAMGFKLYITMNAKGEGEPIPDLEFAAACGMSDRSVRQFKAWLLKHQFVTIKVKGARGRATTFKGKIPEEFACIPLGMPETNSGNLNEECRKLVPAIGIQLPAMAAGDQEIPANGAGSPKESFPPTPFKENNNTTLPSAAGDSVSSSCEEIEGLNGATFEITKFLASNLAVGLSEARTILASDVQIFSADVIACAYAKTRAEMNEPGSKITRPHKYMLEAARGMKNEAKSGASTPSKSARRDRRIDEIVERVKTERGRVYR